MTRRIRPTIPPGTDRKGWRRPDSYVALWACVLALILFVALFFIMATKLYAYGGVPERLGSGLQPHAQEFDPPRPLHYECGSTPITANTPTGIAGCYREGDGIASHYGFGDGVAMNYCTWALRHSDGCGMVTIQSHQTGITVIAPVVDFCDCFTGTADERIIDLQYGVVAALGLSLEQGLYPVTVWREAASSSTSAGNTTLPNTALSIDAEGPWWEWLIVGLFFGVCFSIGKALGGWVSSGLFPKKKP